jgi:hypothetical protein
MHELEVGSLLVPGRTAWPECADFNLYDAGLELRLFLARPTPREVEAARAGEASFYGAWVPVAPSPPDPSECNHGRHLGHGVHGSRLPPSRTCVARAGRASRFRKAIRSPGAPGA